ncbi:ankyrin repeat-containing domain protein [Lactarius akahatsu]|uniref:Ankyrin repeat-containing domain protein n=1 Tax=Lactarius akahatsu TaxID=416441 RepID=A0AAD4LBZ5_9AGAM|nr:ankyrin repeat-containing domain protein [Lactarius akahatsu]
MAQPRMLPFMKIALHCTRHRRKEFSMSHDGYSTTAQMRTHKRTTTLRHFTWQPRMDTWNFVDVNAATKDDRTPLHKASEGGHADVARLLIQHGADANTHLQMLLILASSSESVETVQLLVGLGADVNAQDVGRSTPLNVASSKGNAETVQLLIKLGADVNAQDRSHSTPLHLASSRTWSNAEILQLLIERGADVNV